MRTQNINQHQHKREGNIIYWFTGQKWLIRETCKDTQEAIKLDKEIKERKIKIKDNEDRAKLNSNPA